MSITFDRESYTFKLDTAHTTYMFQVLDGGYLCHLYWGGRIDAVSLPFCPGNMRAPMSGMLARWRNAPIL